MEDTFKERKVSSSLQSEHGWSSEKHPDNIVLSADSLTANRGPEKRFIEAVRGKVEYSSGIHLFRFSWKLALKRHLAIGIVSPNTKLSGNGMVLGSDDQSIGWNIISNQILFNGLPEKTYPDHKKDHDFTDHLLMILNMEEGLLSFQTLTTDFGVAFRGLKRVGSVFHVAAALGAPGDEIKLEYLGSVDESKVVVKTERKSESSITFHPLCGKNILLTNHNNKAERQRPMEVCDHATVLTSRPLRIGESFQVKLEKSVKGKWDSCWKVGVTTNDPASIKFGCEMQSYSKGKVWTFSGNEILRNGKPIDELNADLNDAKVGELAGVKLDGNKLEFSMNGHRQTTVRLDTTEPIFGYVDVYGKASVVSVVGSGCKAEDACKPDNMIKSQSGRNMPETVDEYLKVLETGLSIMKAERKEYISEIYQLMKYLNKVQVKALTDRQRRRAADTLAKHNGAEIIAQYMVFLKANLASHQDAKLSYPLIRDFCFNYSEHSLLLCKKIAKTSLFEACISDMVKFKANYKDSERQTRLLKAGMGILQNCAKVPETKPVFISHKYMDTAKDYLAPNTNPTWACMQTLFTMSYVYEDSEISLLVAPEKVLETMSKCLKNGLKEEHNHECGGWTACELVSALLNLAANMDNVKAFQAHSFLEHLVTMLQVGNDYEKECALNALWNLINDHNKVEISQEKNLDDLLDTLIEDENSDVNQAAIRVKVKLQTGNILLTDGLPVNSGGKSLCQFRKTCKRFLDSLDLSEFFFDNQYDVCYCAVCHGHRGDKVKYFRGNPPKGYGVPVGWCRFGLSPPPKAKALNVFSNWHRAYHGTKKEHVKGILEVGELVPAGRDVIGGAKVKEQDGHFNERRKPFGFDTKQVFLSPSIRYSSVSAYAKPTRFVDPKNHKDCRAKVVFQVLIKPGSYTVGAETIGATGELDPNFSNQELEWSTKQQGSSVLYGLLITVNH